MNLGRRAVARCRRSYDIVILSMYSDEILIRRRCKMALKACQRLGIRGTALLSAPAGAPFTSPSILTVLADHAHDDPGKKARLLV
jgi:hypothetical protein